MSVRIVAPDELLVPMEQDEWGYWSVALEGIGPGTLYYYRLGDGNDRPDPASRMQPQGVHGPSSVVDLDGFQWSDAGWSGVPLHEMVLYELHIGTFTPEGTFEQAATRLDDLVDLGVNALNVMPVAQFPGGRNWGYDGVYAYAVQDSYGGPAGLMEFVDACHARGVALFLDVVYNHLGPEGNYLGEYGPYFTGRYVTPWGKAVNFDDEHSEPVRDYFIGNAIHWLEKFHVDGLRLDAVHSIYDTSSRPFLRELAMQVDALSKRGGRKRYLIAESDLNDPKLLRPWSLGGYGLDAQWSDDFHHSVHTMLTGERNGYYGDFGSLRHLAAVLKEGYAYTGQYSHFRKRRHGSPPSDLPGSQFVVCTQNHDQVGNRMLGERLSGLVSFERLKLAAGALLLSPFVPLLFMGEEYGEPAPFLYMVSHGDPALVEAVRRGRRREFRSFGWEGEPPVPDAPETFRASRLNWRLRLEGGHKILLEFYTLLVRARHEIPALSHLDRETLRVNFDDDEGLLAVERRHDDSRVFFVLNFSDRPKEASALVPEGNWRKVLDSADERWGGAGGTAAAEPSTCETCITAPHCVVLYRN